MNHTANLVSKIKQNVIRQNDSFTVQHTNLVENMLKVLKDRNFIEDFEVVIPEDMPTKKSILVKLSYKNREAAITEIKTVSNPGLRVYKSYLDLKPVLSGRGLQIISTSKGVMSDDEARKLKIGGEVLVSVY